MTFLLITENMNLIRKNSLRFEFHVAKEIRKKYSFDDELFTISGNVIFANFKAVRIFAQKINSKRAAEDHVRPGELNAMGLLDEIFHFIVREYERRENPGVIKRAYDHLNLKLGEEQSNKLLFDFMEIFPPMEVYRGRLSSFDYLNAYSDGRPNREVVLEEMMLLHFADINPANKRLKELFDADYLVNRALYGSAISELEHFFRREKPFGPDNQPIFEFLMTPIREFPDSLEGQLDFVIGKWEVILTDYLREKILKGKDLIKEDIVLDTFGGGGAPTVVPNYKGLVDDAYKLALGKSAYKYALQAKSDYEDVEKFTPDIDWMPRVVLMAKNAYVWMDQLSKKYGRHIHRLDQIPDEELDQLARWNFTGLWLIGIWERSPASKRIKHIMGNIDAVASAYSLYDYIIAGELGGEEAFNNLNHRARQRGIRLASDMVPNHTGIYSKWVIEHPEYFIQTDYPPFPNYQFSGENLSEDPNYQIRIEDGYFRHSDAAVVFQRIDNRTGEVKYIYHGNDGTNMPWNDTAQLNMLKKEVREAVIQKIFEVARRFSIIRFDAAMTLTKRHFSRLWYPEPGSGGDIPSRSDYALRKEDFDNLFPEEFWREVVDRINNELPDTLLLAEAFWLMEGYFVRSLGMHRVYNSAFMNMLMREENEKYRDLITNTLEFEPEILKRYVNFMSNPDEETAIKQFGTDDKYFGVATLMITLPGLPMFGHGQIEGFTEKYGMEYKRAYYNETPNGWLVERHQREIFPLMKKRYLFSQVENFWFYDVFDDHGVINENVFAYTNRIGHEKAIVLYNNKYEGAYGTINRSTPKLVSKNGENKVTTTIPLYQALEINPNENYFCIFRERISNLEFIVEGSKIKSEGYRIQLKGFEYRVFTDFREIYDETGEYKLIADTLGSNGTYDIHRAISEMKLEPVHAVFEELLSENNIGMSVDRIFKEESESVEESRGEAITVNAEFADLFDAISGHFNLKPAKSSDGKEFNRALENIRLVNGYLNKKPFSKLKNAQTEKSFVLSKSNNYRENFILYDILYVVRGIKQAFNGSDIIDKLLLATPVRKILRRTGRGEDEINIEITLLNILLEFGNDKLNLFKVLNSKNKTKTNTAKKIEKLIKERSEEFNSMLEDEYVKAFLRVNYFEGIWYFSKENFDTLVNWLFSLILLDYLQGKSRSRRKISDDDLFKTVNLLNDFFGYLMKLADKSEYKLYSLLVNFKDLNFD